MRLKQVRTGKLIPLHAPQFFFARDRALAEEAFAGDVVGIPNHGTLRIGDTLTSDETLNFVGVPYFAPEILRRVHLNDAMKAKKLRTALQELAEEGVVQLFRPQGRRAANRGRRRHAPARRAGRKARGRNMERRLRSSRHPIRWRAGSSGEKTALASFIASQRSAMADDVDGDPVFLASSAFMMRRAVEAHTGLNFRDIKDVRPEAA